MWNFLVDSLALSLSSPLFTGIGTIIWQEFSPKRFEVFRLKISCISEWRNCNGECTCLQWLQNRVNLAFYHRQRVQGMPVFEAHSPVEGVNSHSQHHLSSLQLLSLMWVETIFQRSGMYFLLYRRDGKTKLVIVVDSNGISLQLRIGQLFKKTSCLEGRGSRIR